MREAYDAFCIRVPSPLLPVWQDDRRGIGGMHGLGSAWKTRVATGGNSVTSTRSDQLWYRAHKWGSEKGWTGVFIWLEQRADASLASWGLPLGDRLPQTTPPEAARPQNEFDRSTSREHGRSDCPGSSVRIRNDACEGSHWRNPFPVLLSFLFPYKWMPSFIIFCPLRLKPEREGGPQSSKKPFNDLID